MHPLHIPIDGILRLLRQMAGERLIDAQVIVQFLNNPVTVTHISISQLGDLKSITL